MMCVVPCTFLHKLLELQVVLDEAAFLMDLATVDGNWDDVVDRIADCYREAGIHDIAKFIVYRE
jgi:hypothetical protein